MRKTLQSLSNRQGRKDSIRGRKDSIKDRKDSIRGKTKECLLCPAIFTVRKMIRSRVVTFVLNIRRVVRYLLLSRLFLRKIKFRKAMSTIFIKIMMDKLSSQLFRNVRLMLVRIFTLISTSQVLIPRLFMKSIPGQENRGSIQLVRAKVILQISSKESKKLLELQHVFRQDHSIKNQLSMFHDQEVRWIILVVQVSVTLTKIC